MSNPIDPTPESFESAAEYRVSAQELSHVVTIIQARKEAEARQRANTVALGDAVEQLGLDMTPEELLAEIRADRSRRSGGSRPKRQLTAQRRTFATFAVCAGLAGMMVSSLPMQCSNRTAWESRNSPFYVPYGFPVESASLSPNQITIEATPAIEMPSADVTPPAPPQSAEAEADAKPNPFADATPDHRAYQAITEMRPYDRPYDQGFRPSSSAQDRPENRERPAPPENR